MIVFRVADPDRVVDRDPESEQRLSQARGFSNRLRQDHHAPAIERQDERLFERSDHVEHRAGPCRVGLDDRLTGHEGDAASLKLLQERRVRHVSQEDVSRARRKLEHRAIFSDDDVEAG